MNEISTHGGLIRYIRLMLGEPLIKVELTDQHIAQVINDTVKMYTDVVYGFFETTELAELRSDSDYHRRLLDWDQVKNVMDATGSKDIPFHWDSIKRTLRIQRSESGNQKVIIIGEKRYTVDLMFDLIFNESWVKDMAKAKTQLLWGQTLGKYSQSLVGGAEINYDRIISEAQSDIDRLMEELHEKWTDPSPVLVG